MYMKFKQKASERAIYKTLSLFSGLFLLFGALSILYGVMILVIGIMIGGDSYELGSMIGSSVGTLIFGVILSIVSHKLADIRDNMIEYPESEL